MKRLPLAIALAGSLLLGACGIPSISVDPTASPSGSATPTATTSPTPSASTSPSPTSVFTPPPTIGHMITARTGHTATLLASGRVLVVGGAPTSLSGPALASVETYDPASNSWSAAPSLSTGREFHTATALPDGRVLVLGGQAQASNQTVPDGTPLASAEIFDPARGTWSAAKPMPRPRSGHVATMLGNGLVLVAGGDKLQADLYNPATDAWTSAGTVPMPMSRPQQTATVLGDGRVLIAPGFTADGMPFGPTPLYDPKANSWTTVGPMTWGRTEAVGSALMANGDVLEVGASAAGVPGATAEIFTPSTKSWTAVLTDTQDTRFNFWTALALPSGKGMAFAGPSPTVPGTPAGKIYDPKTHGWSPARPLAHPRGDGFTATLLPNGKILVAGGRDPDPVSRLTAAAEQYSP